MANVRGLAKLLLEVDFEQPHVPLHEGNRAVVLHVEIKRAKYNRFKLDESIL